MRYYSYPPAVRAIYASVTTVMVVAVAGAYLKALVVVPHIIIPGSIGFYLLYRFWRQRLG